MRLRPKNNQIFTVCFSLTLMCSTFVFAQGKANDKAADKKKKADTSKDDGAHLRMLGKPVLVTKSGAELKTRKGVVWKAYLGEVFTVAEVEGEWYWIREKGGWLWKKNTVPLDTAVAQFSAAIEKKPSAEAYHQRGIAYAAIDDHENAIADYSKTIEIKPQYAGAYVNRGNSHRSLSNQRKAISDYSAAITVDEKNFVAYNNRALVYTELKEFDKAMGDLNRALQLSKQYAEAYNNRGVVWREKGDFRKAILDYSNAIKIYPAFVEAYGNRGFALNKLGAYDSALANFSQAARLKPFDPQTLNDLAWMVSTCPDEKFRNAKLAVDDAEKACKLTKRKDWNSLDTLAAAYAESEKFEDAAKVAKQALKLAPKNKKDAITKRIALYESGKPFRDG